MKNLLHSLLSLMAAAGAVLCLMGAEGQLRSAATVSAADKATNSPASGIARSVTGSAAGKKSSSVSDEVTGTAAGKAAHGMATGATGSAAPAVRSRTMVTLSPCAEELAKILKFDRQVLLLVEEVTNEPIQRLVGSDEDSYQIIAAGIAVSVPEDKTDGILAQLRRGLAPFHYMAFVVEMNEGLKKDKIGVIKGTDQYEILRIMHTNGDEYGISNEDLVNRLKEWEEIAPFIIIGADSDWVKLEFKTLPKDLKSFAKDVYEFSSHAVEQGAGSVEELIKEIGKTRRLFLSWD